MGQQQRIDPAKRDPELTESDGSAATGVDQQLLIPRLDQCGRSESIRAGDWRAGPEQRHFEIAPTHHYCCRILMPESVTTFTQCAISLLKRAPKAAAVPMSSIPVGVDCNFLVSRRFARSANRMRHDHRRNWWCLNRKKAPDSVWRNR
jgi:hypothetical protein